MATNVFRMEEGVPIPDGYRECAAPDGSEPVRHEDGTEEYAELLTEFPLYRGTFFLEDDGN